MNDDRFESWHQLGQLLREHREGSRLSVVQAAVKAGFSESVWRQLEKGERLVGRDVLPPNPRTETLIRAAATVGLDPNRALAVVGRPPVPTLPTPPPDDNDETADLIQRHLTALNLRLVGIESQVAALAQSFEKLFHDDVLPGLAPRSESLPDR